MIFIYKIYYIKKTMTFLEFLEQKKSRMTSINEAFKKDDFKKVSGLVSSLLTKETGKSVYYLWEDECKMGGKEYICKLFGVFKDGKKSLSAITTVFSINFEKSDNSRIPASVWFFDDNSVHSYLTNAEDIITVNVALDIKIKGASVAHFIPIITRVINTGDLTLKKDEAEKLAKSVEEGLSRDFFKKSGVIQYGNLKYNVFDTIYERNKNIITMIENVKDTELGQERTKAGQEMRAAVARGDKDAAKHFRKKYLSIIDAIKGGATTIEEWELYVEHNQKATFSVSNDVPQKALDKFREESKKTQKDPEAAFKEMRGYLSMVTSGIQPGLIICGAPGIGKTYRVTKFLKLKGYDVDKGNLHIIKGRCTTRNLYLDLYNFQEKGDIILIDDADSLISPKAPEDTINLLKAALDSNDDGGRLVSYRVGGRLTDDEGQEVPKSFKYNGSIIVLTNYNVGQLDTAIKGRVFTQDMDFSTSQLLELVKKIMPAIGEGKLSSIAKMEAYDYLTELSESDTKIEVSIRSFITCARLCQMAQDNPEFTAEDVKSMIKDQVEHQAMRGGKKY